MAPLVTIVSVSAAVFSVLVGIAVFYGDRHNRYRRSFVFLSLFVCLWVIGNLVYSGTTGETQFMIALACYTVAMLLAVQLFAFCLNFMRRKLAHRRLILYSLPGIVMALLSLIPSFIAYGIEDQVIVTNMPALLLYGVVLIVYLAGACTVLLKGRRSLSRQGRRIASVILIGMSVSALTGAVFNLILPVLGVYDFTQLGPASSVLFIGSVAYTIVKHGFFDVRAAVVRSIAYILSLASLAGVYFGLAYILSLLFLQGAAASGINVSPTNIILALLLAFIFQPIKQFFDRVTDKVFFRNRYDTDEFIRRLGEVLTSTTKLNVLLKSTAEELRNTLKASYAAFTVFQTNEQHVMVGAGRFPGFTIDERRRMGQLVAGLQGKVLVVSEAVELPTAMDERLLRTLERRRVALLIPLSSDLGYLLLGEALSNSYTQRDIKTLSAISDELVIAIQNARSVQEVRDLNTHLQQRIDHATQELRESNNKLVRLDETKDEFVSMASHQLRTPLTSIKGYLSMVLEGDMGEVSPAQRKVLGEAYTSSERMVRLIGDFLNISRLQTGKFVIDTHPTDLSKVISQEVEAMQQLAESHDMMVVYKRPRVFPVLNVDEDKLRQVIMNFVDNAIYYSRPKSTIVVKSYVEGADAVVEVHDHGIGVPVHEQEKLFTKFFRAENARRQRPDGTGVGLFLARKVVTALGGEIIFTSQEGKGSVFGFRLPIKKLEAKK